MKRINIAGLLLCLVALVGCSSDDPTDFEKRDLSEEMLNALSLESMSANPNVPGSIALVDIPDQFIWFRAEGLASIENGAQMSVDHQFLAASITKTMVATIVQQLGEEGRLNLDDAVASWIEPEILNELIQGSEILTVRHLLNHSSGIYDYLDDGQVHLEAFANNPDGRYSNLERLAIADERGSPYYPVGTGFRYSNTNYILLGMVIEAVTGVTLQENFENRIFNPLGMTQSHIANESLTNNLAQGYYQDFNVTSFSSNFNYGSADGGLVTTVADLHLFARAFFSGNLFDQEKTLQEMLINYGSDYGLGIRIFNSSRDMGMVWGHDGADPGYFCYMVYAEKSSAIIIYVGNRAETEVNDPAVFVNQILVNL